MTDAPNIEVDREVLGGFIEESLEALASVDSALAVIETTSEKSATINSIFRPVHSLKGSAPFFGLMATKNLAHELESLLALVRDGKCAITSTLVNHLLLGIDELKRILSRVQSGKTEIENQEYYAALLENTKALCTNQLTSSLPAALSEVSSMPSAPSAGAADGGSSGGQGAVKTMRVTEERIDTFLAFVGELIIAGEMLRHVMGRLSDNKIERTLVREMRNVNEVFTRLSSDLERAIMSVRRVPIKTILQKVPRLVRDIATKQGKDIRVEIIGEALEIDKSLVEMLDAPIIHMVRNSADHGVEPTKLRDELGKPKQGTVTIRCEEEETQIVITVEDDGRGLNLEALQKKAVSLGMCAPGSALSEEQLISLLFLPGVSTAAEVSDISGRGVGMDVVKQSIEAAGGSISVETSNGHGTKFTLRLRKQVGTQIISGLVVVAEDNFFVIPMEFIDESWSINSGAIQSAINKGFFVSRHESILPFFSLASIMDDCLECQTEFGRMATTIHYKNRQIAVAIDDIVGVKQLVLKDIEGIENKNENIRGGALLGDGSVALVVDVPTIFEKLDGDFDDPATETETKQIQAQDAV